MAYAVNKTILPELVYEKDAEIAERVLCPTHGKACKYHCQLDEHSQYHAYAICRKCGWVKEF